MVFKDRYHAGRQLAARLTEYQDQGAIVLALPKGGVPVGYEIAKILDLPLNVFPVRKIGAPFNQEYAIGAVAPYDTLYLEKKVIEKFAIAQDEIDAIVEQEKQEMKRQEKLYRSGKLSLKNQLVILTDDGLATGATAKAAVMAMKKKHPQKIILAVPVCPFGMKSEFATIADEFVCIDESYDFTAVGAAYTDFHQVSDEEVLKLL